MVRQNDLFRRYADLGANPGADFRNLAYEVGEDPAMLRFLNGELNRSGRPNENYARELMELFCLGVVDAAGNPNYTETDVRELARALSGWQISTADANNPRGVFVPSRFDNGTKSFLGRSGNFGSRQAVDIVLAHPAHPGFIVRKLWSEFIAGAPDAATLADLTATYTGSGLQLKPLLRKILTHPQLFDSLAEPTLIKPPVVYAAGAFRQLGLNVVNTSPYTRLREMGQLPLLPAQRGGLGIRRGLHDDERRAQPLGTRLGSRQPHRGGANRHRGGDATGGIRPRLRRHRSPLARRTDEGGHARLRDPRARRERHEQASATALAAGDGPLRPRQPGDVSR